MASLAAQARVRPAELATARAAGVLFFVLAAGFMTVIMVAPSMAPGFDYGNGAISDLGTLPETSLLFNLALLLVGVLNAAAGLLFYRSHGRRWILALSAIAALGAAGAGLFPLDGGGPHGLFALTAFLAFNLQSLGVATVVHGPMRTISIVAGTVGLLYVVLMVMGDGGNAAAFGPIGHGGTERMIVYPAMLSMLALGGYLLRDGQSQ